MVLSVHRNHKDFRDGERGWGGERRYEGGWGVWGGGGGRGEGGYALVATLSPPE